MSRSLKRVKLSKVRISLTLYVIVHHEFQDASQLIDVGFEVSSQVSESIYQKLLSESLLGSM